MFGMRRIIQIIAYLISILFLWRLKEFNRILINQILKEEPTFIDYVNVIRYDHGKAVMYFLVAALFIVSFVVFSVLAVKDLYSYNICWIDIIFIICNIILIFCIVKAIQEPILRAIVISIGALSGIMIGKQ